MFSNVMRAWPEPSGRTRKTYSLFATIRHPLRTTLESIASSAMKTFVAEVLRIVSRFISQRRFMGGFLIFIILHSAGDRARRKRWIGGSIQAIVAEGEGLEPPQACARRFSRPLQYHYASPPLRGAGSIYALTELNSNRSTTRY